MENNYGKELSGGFELISIDLLHAGRDDVFHDVRSLRKGNARRRISAALL